MIYYNITDINPIGFLTMNSLIKLPLYHRATSPASKRLLYPVLCFIMLSWSTGLFAEAPRVAVSVSPVHSLVSGVMQGVGVPELLILPGHSPHVQPLSPSAVKAAYGADLLVWVGPGFEVTMSKIVGQIERQDRVKSLMDDASLHTLPLREQSMWSEHGHGHGQEDEEDGDEEHEGEEDGDEEHEGEEDGDEEHEDEEHEDEEHEAALDPHVWLSTDNAILIVSAFTDWISRIDSDNKDLYQSNRDKVIARIHQTKGQMSELLESIRTVPYIVFHDAWQYYENEHQLNAQTSVSRSADHAPVIRQIQDLNQLIRERDVRCVFREPQFESRIIPTVIEGTQAKVGVLDPVGAELTPGPDMWHELMLSIATSLKTCLSGE